MCVSRWAKFNKSCSRTKHFQANNRLFFSKNWTCPNRTTRTTQNSQFWVVYIHLFASCLPRNQENQPPKTDHSSPHRLKQLQMWVLKTSIWWVIRRIVLTWHRMTSFYSRTSKIKWEANVFWYLKKRLMRSECMFLRYLNQSGKSASTIGSNTCKYV